MVPTTISQCPSTEFLADFVAGTLSENEADSVCQHIVDCVNCRLKIDEMVSDSDSLLKALRNPASRREPETVDAQLDDMLFSAANRIPAEQAAHSDFRPSRQPNVQLATFVNCLRKSGLYENEIVDFWLYDIAPSDSLNFARELVAQKKLTPFQAGLLLRGRHKGLVLGNYIVLEKLGRGGMGHVYKARHRKMGRVVCLKVLHATGKRKPELVERFRREAQAVAALSHPNIVVAHDADEALGLHFLVMEFVPGSDLARHIHENGPMPVHEAVQLVLQVANALQYAHGVGVVHRDIKPHNLLLDDSGTIKILDMGLARFDSILTDSPDAVTNNFSMTNSGVVIGTVDYMAPEQALNSRNADHQSDIYSLGCTLHFLLTGKPLYSGETVMEILVAHREGDVPTLSNADPTCPPALDAIFQRMVAKNREERYASMEEAASDLQAFLDGHQPAAISLVPMKLRSLGEQWLQSRLGIAALLLLATLFGIVIGHYLPKSDNSTDSNNLAQSAGDGSRETGTEQQVRRARSSALPNPEAHPNILANNGPGRALIVLPHHWFYEDNYLSLKKALSKRGVDIVTASSRMGNARPKHWEIRPVPIDITLDQARIEDFDMIVFIGGNTGEFTHKNKYMQEVTRKILAASLDKPRVLAGIQNGFEPVKEAIQSLSCARDCTYKKTRQMLVGYPRNHRARFVQLNHAGGAYNLVAMAFEELLPDRRGGKR